MRRFRLFLARVGRRTVRCPSVSPPLGILGLAAAVRKRFPVDIELMDQMVDNCSPLDVVRRAIAFDGDITGIRTLTTSAKMTARIVAGIRIALPKTLIVVGGPHVSAFGAASLAEIGADAAVVGEGERSFEMIVEARLNGSALSDIPGLVWRDKGGEVHVNPGQAPQIEDLDALPLPACDLLDMERYGRVRSMANVPPHRYAALFTSRGCPHQCTYCHRIFGKHFRAQSPERIVEEIEYYQRRFGINEFEFLDDIFNLDAKRVVEFADLVHRRNLHFKTFFPNALRTDIITPETADALKSFGTCYSACALESGSTRIQKMMRKHLNIPRFLEGVALLGSRGIFTQGFTMLGFPTETEEEMEQTIDTVYHSQLHISTFFTVTPYPNTELYDVAARSVPERLAVIDYENTNYTDITVNLSDVSDERFFAIQRKAWRRFYSHPRRLLRILRDYPNPLHIPHYLPMFMLRLSKGLMSFSAQVATVVWQGGLLAGIAAQAMA